MIIRIQSGDNGNLVARPGRHVEIAIAVARRGVSPGFPVDAVDDDIVGHARDGLFREAVDIAELYRLGFWFKPHHTVNGVQLDEFLHGDGIGLALGRHIHTVVVAVFRGLDAYGGQHTGIVEEALAQTIDVGARLNRWDWLPIERQGHLCKSIGDGFLGVDVLYIEDEPLLQRTQRYDISAYLLQ